MSDALARTESGPTESGLTAFEADLLAFEATGHLAPEGKEAAILRRFDLSVPRYYQELNALIDKPEALAHATLLVKRLRRQRESRQQRRSARPLSAAAAV